MIYQYIFLIIGISLALFLIALGLNRISKIFFGNYFAGFNSIVGYLFIDILINLIDQQKIHPTNYDALSGFLFNNKTLIIIGIYFISFILFYKNSLIKIEFNTSLKKVIGFLFFPILTILNLIFTMILIINGPELLTYQKYQNFILNLKLNNYFTNLFLMLPNIVLIFSILVLAFFININIKIYLPFGKDTKATTNDSNLSKNSS